MRVDPTLRFDRALVGLAGISRAVERFESSAQHQVRRGAWRRFGRFNEDRFAGVLQTRVRAQSGLRGLFVEHRATHALRFGAHFPFGMQLLMQQTAAGAGDQCDRNDRRNPHPREARRERSDDAESGRGNQRAFQRGIDRLRHRGTAYGR